MPWCITPLTWNSKTQGHHVFIRKGVKIGREMWYSVTPEPIANQIAETVAGLGPPCIKDSTLIAPDLRNDLIILDAFAGVGGNAIQFARCCGYVIATDIAEDRLHSLKHNANIYECDHRIDCVVADAQHLPFRRHANSKKNCSTSHPYTPFDVVFLSPPWGGPKYSVEKNISLMPWISFNPRIYRMSQYYQLGGTVIYYLPRNFNLDDLRSLCKMRCAYIQPYLQRSSVTYHDSLHGCPSYLKLNDQSDGWENHQARENNTFEVKDEPYQHHIPPLWSWKTTAVTVYTGDGGIQYYIESHLFEDFCMSRWIRSVPRQKYRSVQLRLMRKAATVWAYGIGNLLGLSGLIPGSCLKKNRMGRPITYQSKSPDIRSIISNVLNKIFRLLRIAFLWIISRFRQNKTKKNPTARSDGKILDLIQHSINLVTNVLFKVLIKYGWTVSLSSMEWFILALLQNWDIQQLNDRLQRCLTKILLLTPRAKRKNDSRTDTSISPNYYQVACL